MHPGGSARSTGGSGDASRCGGDASGVYRRCYRVAPAMTPGGGRSGSRSERGDLPGEARVPPGVVGDASRRCGRCLGGGSA